MSLIQYENLKSKGIRYSRMQLRRKERAGTFPMRVRLSEKRVAWFETDIDAWIASRPRGILSRRQGGDTAMQASA